jgi:hypothetical protein
VSSGFNESLRRPVKVSLYSLGHANWKGEAAELRSVETNLGEERRRGSTKQEKRGAYQTDLHHLDVATAKVVKSVFLSQCYLYKVTGSCCLGGCSIYMKGSLQLKDNNEQ